LRGGAVAQFDSRRRHNQLLILVNYNIRENRRASAKLARCRQWAAAMVLEQRSKLSVSDLCDPRRFPKSDYIELLYRVMLQREPDPNGLRSYSRREDTKNFLQELLSSREFQEVSRNTAYFAGNPNERRRILLFGAYGNGNLGDAIQAMSLWRAIKQIRSDVDVWACSQLPCQFPFPFEYVLPSKQIHNPLVLNQFDLMIIGGGGLLSHPHDPLTNEEWQRAVDVPTVILGVGAGGPVVSKSKTLISKAVYVSGRDDPSLTALGRIRNDVRFVPDPVLADTHYYLNSADHRTYHNSPGSRLWIIKNTKGALSTNIMQMIDLEQDKICFVEPFLDFPLLDSYPTARPIYFVDDLLALIDQAMTVISMRYHGCILALLRAKPIVGLFERKSLDLLTRYDLGCFFCNNMTPIPDFASFASAEAKLLSDQDIFRAELTKILALIPVSS